MAITVIHLLREPALKNKPSNFNVIGSLFLITSDANALFFSIIMKIPLFTIIHFAPPKRHSWLIAIMIINMSFQPIDKNHRVAILLIHLKKVTELVTYNYYYEISVRLQTRKLPILIKYSLI